MSHRSKRYREGAAKVESRTYSVDEAVALLQSMPRAKFDQSVERHMNLGIDPRQRDQIVRGAVSLPAGIGASPEPQGVGYVTTQQALS